MNASAAGTATLGIRFANGTTTARPAGLVVNGSTVQTPSFEGTGAWSTWSTKTLTVALNAGVNTLRLSPTTAAGLPNVDFLDAEVGGEHPPPANALYVAPTGNDSNAGTLAAPLQTIQRAVDLAQPGHTIVIRGGTYAPSTNIQILKNGTASQPITLRNYNSERVILDGENMPYTPGAVDSPSPGPSAAPSTSRATGGG